MINASNKFIFALAGADKNHYNTINMNKFIKRTIIFLYFLFCVQPCFSQSRMDLISQALEETENRYEIQRPALKETLSSVRQAQEVNAASLRDENMRLRGQYQMLQVDYDNKKNAVSQYQFAIENFQRQLETLKQSHKDYKNSSFALTETEKIENELLIKQSKHFYLKGQLLDVEEKIRLAKMQLADLKFQKEELSLNLKTKMFSFNEEKRKQDEEKARYNAALRANLEKEKTLLQKIRRLEEDSSYFTDKTKKIRGEVDFLKKQVENFKVQKELSDKEISLIKKKQLFVNKSFEDVLKLKTEMKRKLEDEVLRVEKEYANLDKMVEQSASFRQRQQELMKQVIEVDKANQSLRAEMEQITRKRELND